MKGEGAVEQIHAEVQSPGGRKGRLYGFQLHELLVLLLIFVCSAFIWWADEQRSKSLLAQHAITQKLLGNVIAN